MKKLFVIVLIAILCACTSRPATNGIAVAGMDLDAAIREAATQMETRIPAGTMVALVSVASPSTAFSTQVLTRLESAIVSGGKLIVVDRANLDKVRAEQGFQLSGEVDDESAKSIGRLLGAGAIVTGSLTDLGDVYSLIIKAINIETATVSVSYLADLTKTTRIETLLATRDGEASGGTAQETTVRIQPTTSSTSATTTSSAPVRFTVTFNANGASGRAPSAQTILNGESITIPDISEMTNTRGTFDGWNTRADGTGTPFTAGDSFSVNANTSLYAQWVEIIYQIGDRGPAGGWIFFDMGFYIDGWRYLEAAPQDYPTRVRFADRVVDTSGIGPVLGNTDTTIGTGIQNTTRIASALNSNGETLRATQVVSVPRYGSYDDWFLPSIDELNMMYENLHRQRIGGFSNSVYWSSSANVRLPPFIRGARQINFSNGEHLEVYTAVEGLVRAVRRF